MKNSYSQKFPVVLGVLLFAGCGQQKTPAPKANASAQASSPYILMDKPKDALDVAPARKDSKDGDEIVVVGRIGGSENPWVEGSAAFSLVDRSLKPCNEIEGDGCPKPWDYCCELDALPKSKILIKVVDKEDKLVQTDARELLGVKELQTVVVRGKAKRDDAGNLTVLADGVHVLP